MKKEDFIVGKWYLCSEWVRGVIAAKFKEFNKSNEFTYSQIVHNNVCKTQGGSSYHKNLEKYKEIPISEIQHLLPTGHPDLINNINNFPNEGCYFDDDDILVNYLIKNNYTQNNKYSSKSSTTKYLKWNDFQYWYVYHDSIEFKNYTTQQIHQLINYNTNQNEKNTLQSIETENSRPNHIGTIAIRRGRQQITVGNRPNGNKTSAKIGRTEINSIKICKNIVQSANY